MVRLSLGGKKKAAKPAAADLQPKQQDEPMQVEDQPAAFDFSQLDKSGAIKSLCNGSSRSTKRPNLLVMQTPPFRAAFHGLHGLVIPSHKFVTFTPLFQQQQQATVLKQCMDCFVQTKLSDVLTVEDRIRAYQRIYSKTSTERKLWELVDALYGNTHRRPGARLSGFGARMLQRQNEEINVCRVEGLDVWLRVHCASQQQYRAGGANQKRKPTLQDLRRATLLSQQPTASTGQAWLDEFANVYWKSSLSPLKKTLIQGEANDPVFALLFFAAKPTKPSLERFLSTLRSTNSAWHFAQVLFELVPLSERTQILMTLDLAREMEQCGELESCVFLLEHYIQDESVKEKMLLDLVTRCGNNNSVLPEYKHWARACKTRNMDQVILSGDQDFFCTEFGRTVGPQLCVQAKFAELAKFERYLVTDQVKPWEEASLLWSCLLVRFAKLNVKQRSMDTVAAFQVELERLLLLVSFKQHGLCRSALQNMAEYVCVKQQSKPAQLARALQLLPVSVDLKKKMIALHAGELLLECS